MADAEAMQTLIALVQSLTEKCEILSGKLQNMSLKLEASTPAVSVADDRELSENADGSTLPNDNALPLVMKELKSYLELITEFEGNNISVETFIFEIKTVLINIPEDQKKTFIRLIILKKIINNAREAIDGHDIRSFDDLFEILRNNFGESNSFVVAFLERSQCQQGISTVLEYNKKFNGYHLDVQRAINDNSEYTIQERKTTLSNEERLGLSQYIRGLCQSIKLFVRATNPKSIREAQNLALEIEKEENISRFVYNSFNSQDQESFEFSDLEDYDPEPENSDDQNDEISEISLNCCGCDSAEHYIQDCPTSIRFYTTFQEQITPNRPPETKFAEPFRTDTTQQF